MQITKDDLRKTYRNLSNDEIEHLIFHETSFTSVALEVLKEEVYRRRLPNSWSSRVDEKGGTLHSGGFGRNINQIKTPSEPFSIINAIALVLGALFPALSEIAFIVIWVLLCYVVYVVVDSFFS